jgi:Fic family protein
MSKLGMARDYPHWDDLIHRTAPEGMDHELWWLAHKLKRNSDRREIPLKDVKGRHFSFGLPDLILELLRKVDSTLSGHMGIAHPILSGEGRDRYVFSSLVEEAITSSQLEGAATTRQVAKEMIRSGRPPRDHSERMILNNFRAMERIRDLVGDPLSARTVRDLHRIITLDTLDEKDAGRLQEVGEERVGVWDEKNERLHDPPPASELRERLEAMCAFANGETPAGFVHPVVRAILLHFWLAYDHPFVDGNGRTARALFYWSMLRQGYWLAEFVPISSVMRKAPVQYGRAFLLVESDENDLTYFLVHQLRVVEKAIAQFEGYVRKKVDEQEENRLLLRASRGLNHRQLALLGHAARHPDASYTIESHRASHRVVYQTARVDLLRLEELGLLKRVRLGRTFQFIPARDLAERLKVMAKHG